MVDDDPVGAKNADRRPVDQDADKGAGLRVVLANAIVELVADVERVVVGRAAGATAAAGP
jgi:hypothetical protein